MGSRYAFLRKRRQLVSALRKEFKDYFRFHAEGDYVAGRCVRCHTFFTVPVRKPGRDYVRGRILHHVQGHENP